MIFKEIYFLNFCDERWRGCTLAHQGMAHEGMKTDVVCRRPHAPELGVPSTLIPGGFARTMLSPKFWIQKTLAPGFKRG